MNNELGRKITSLTLMTIMVAGGMTFAVPGMMPAAYAANANLFVSAENSQFDNYMSGPQVIEVVVIDSDINDTDEGEGEPDVTVNGKILRMTQAVDGNWYGYFADINQALIADSTASMGDGLDFGAFCESDATVTDGTVVADFGDTVGIAIPDLDVAGIVQGFNPPGPITATCGDIANDGDTDDSFNNVVREAKNVNLNAAANGDGQIGMDEGLWPLIQLYPLNPTGNVIVQYNKGGGVQTTTLTFDTVENFAGIELDRSIYPRGAQIHATITDLWLNIDPTDEDSWTFGTLDSDATTNYQVFDENGNRAGDINGTAGVIDISPVLSDLMCEDNCVLLLDTNAQGTGDVVTLQDNDDSVLAFSSSIVDASRDNAEHFATFSGALNGTLPVTITEQGPNSGVFGTYDESDISVIKVISDAKRGTSATIDYNEDPVTVLIGHSFGSVDIMPTDDEWNSGEEIPVEVVDSDANKNSRADEDLDLFNPEVRLIPSLRTGDPFTLGESDINTVSGPLSALVFADDPTSVAPLTFAAPGTNTTSIVQTFNHRALIIPDADATSKSLVIDLETTMGDLRSSINEPSTSASGFKGFNLVNIDMRAFTGSDVDVWLLDNLGADIVTDTTNSDGSLTSTGLAASTTARLLVEDVDTQSITRLNDVFDTPSTPGDLFLFNSTAIPDSAVIGLLINGTTADSVEADIAIPVVADFFSFGFEDDGSEADERIGNQIVRIEAEETGDNTGVFEGSLEYVMLNQLNILDASTYEDLSPIADDPSFIVVEDLTDEDAPRVNYLDLGADGVSTQVADQEEAPSHSGIVSFDLDTYKVADTVTITLEDLDLNVDSDLLEIYTVVEPGDPDVPDTVGAAGLPTGFTFGNLGRLLDVTFDDLLWTTPTAGTCDNSAGVFLEDLTSDTGLAATGFTLVETGPESGKFIGDFQIPTNWCEPGTADVLTTTGLDIEVNYVDFRDASGEIIEVGDSAGVRANTGSVSLDRTVYPVPFGVPDDFGGAINETSPDGNSVFAIHLSGMTGGLDIDDDGSFLPNGDLTVHIRVNDPDFDISASGEDFIAEDRADAPGVGPVKLSVIRGSESVIIGYAGGVETADNTIFVGDDPTAVEEAATRQFGPINEIAPDAGIFEIDISIRYTDGPSDTQCPRTLDYTDLEGPAAGVTPTAGSPDDELRFSAEAPSGESYCILQGDILQVEYTDPTDASGDVNTVTDSATFDLRNGVLQSDKSVYIIGSDMILTLIEPDFDLDNDQAETYTLDLIEWDSDAATLSMGARAGNTDAAAFDPEPADFRETGDSTGIFQIVIEIPEELDGDRLERGEEIVLEYSDWGPSGSDYVGEEDEDINVTLFTSNFGATVELDQKVYSWTDKVYVTVVAPDHNFDGDLIDEIGNTDLDPIKIATRGADLRQL